jgi:hypothetical protein
VAAVGRFREHLVDLAERSPTLADVLDSIDTAIVRGKAEEPTACRPRSRSRRQAVFTSCESERRP